MKWVLRSGSVAIIIETLGTSAEPANVSRHKQTHGCVQSTKHRYHSGARWDLAVEKLRSRRLEL
jgi:hypothetical protein